MPPRRAPPRRSSRFDSPATASASGVGTSIDTPLRTGATTPASLKSSTPGTTPSVEDSAGKVLKGKGKAKRPLPSDDEGSDDESTSPPINRPSKRSKVFVEVTRTSFTTSSKSQNSSQNTVQVKESSRVVQKSSAKAKGKQKAIVEPSDQDSDDIDESEVPSESEASASEFELSDNPISDAGAEGGGGNGDSDADVPLAKVVKGKFKDKGKAVASTSKSRPNARITRGRLANSSDIEPEFLQLSSNVGSDSEDMELDDNLALIAGAAENDEDEADDLLAAIQASLGTSGKAKGKKTGYLARVERAAAAARAAERRAGGSGAVDDSGAWEHEDEDESEDALDSDDLDSDGPDIKPKKKGQAVKGKGKAKEYTIADTSKPRHMTYAQRKKLAKKAKALLKASKAPLRAKQMEMRKKLGRRLTWAERTSIALLLYHPELEDVWGDLEADIPIVKPERSPQPPGFRATLLPFQQESIYWMRKQEQGVWGGGVLADEMGMGKTIQMLALLSSDRRSPNLIVAPTVAIMQWKNEIEAHTEGFKVVVWHGQSRTNSHLELAKSDIILTTYAVLESAFRKQEKGFTRKGESLTEKSPLHQIHWERVILDEAHNIKERSTNTAKGAFQLKSTYRWCLSGTPLQNRVGELYSLVRFLGSDPFAYYFCKSCDCKSLHWKFSNKKECDECGHTPMMHTCFWNNEILTPIQKHGMVGPGRTAFKKLKILLDRVMLRRTKLERADDLGLPPRTVIVRRDYFSPEEKELYLSLFSDAKRQFSTYADQGTLLNNYSNIFSLLTRMRQMACHPDLVLKSKRNADLAPDLVETTVCRLCFEVGEDPIESSCHHIFCRTCITQYVEACQDSNPQCPVCHIVMTIDLEAPAIEQDEDAMKKARQGILGRLDHSNWRSSTKIEALIEDLETVRHKDASTKSIVFSQFVNFLDLIAWRLQKAGFVICRLEGTMSPQARDATIKHFMNNVEVTVFLVSLKAGGVALNLTEASRVYLMDSWWNPAVEYQAMDRIHRLGQHRPVHAIKLVVEDSIESRIVQLQEKKSAMVDATLSTDESAMGRLTAEDLGFLFRL